MKNPWKTLDSKIVYQNKWIKVREDKVIRPDETDGIYGVVDASPAIYVIALTEDQEIYLVGQFRYATQMYSLEVPAGGSDGEDLLVAAKRELQEETGFTAGIWEDLGSFQGLNGYCSEMGYIFLARDLKQTDSNKQNEEGITEIKKIPIKTALDMIKSGEISDSQSIAAITKAYLYIYEDLK